jgi:hypothetical protein
MASCDCLSRSGGLQQYFAPSIFSRSRSFAVSSRYCGQVSAKILKPAQDVFWGGYSGYFADLDGYPWEVAFNPHWPLQPDGSLRLPTA